MSTYKSDLIIGSYIGCGSFGEVYHAKDSVHGDVAAKCFTQKTGESSADWTERKKALLFEGQKLKQATHKNVVQVFSVAEGESGDEIILVMELCEGGSLDKKYKNGPMSLKAVRKHATDACLGLNALHSRGMLHRDLKPGNLLLTSSGVTKLGDFGHVTDNLLLGYGSAAGYADHIAPEVWNGSGTSRASDLWALGMTLYRLMHGSIWYSEAPQPSKVVAKGGFGDTLKWMPHTPKPWRRFIRKLLNDDPHARFRDVNQVISALSSLPSEPVWNTSYDGVTITWKRTKGSRRIIVKWEMLPKGKHSWFAKSVPIGSSGRKRTLGSSKGEISYSSANKALRKFFSKQS